MTRYPPDVATYQLDAAERATLERLGDRLAARHGSAEDADFLFDARHTAFTCLPAGLVQFLEAFRLREVAPVTVIDGIPVDDDRIGPTPSHWAQEPQPHPTLALELLFVVMSAVLGDAFGWETLQHGHLVQNVLPIRHQESEQSGHGSVVNLAWHTEDGFHPCRCDYLGLLSLRNHGRVPTTFATLTTIALPARVHRVLSEPRFIIRPDDEHVHQRTRNGDGVAVPRSWLEPAPTAVLFGDIRDPYLRIDPFFMGSMPGDDEAAAALAHLVDALDTGLEDLVLDAGSVCFIDNYRAVHGRKAFTPAFDGADRWLKKVVVTRDLRKSRAIRATVDARVLQSAALGGEL